jgi:hypothetical protein
MQTGAKSDWGAAARYIPRIGGKRGDERDPVIAFETALPHVSVGRIVLTQECNRTLQHLQTCLTV